MIAVRTPHPTREESITVQRNTVIAAVAAAALLGGGTAVTAADGGTANAHRAVSYNDLFGAPPAEADAPGAWADGSGAD